MRLLRPAGEAAGGGGVFAAFCGGGEGEIPEGVGGEQADEDTGDCNS